MKVKITRKIDIKNGKTNLGIKLSHMRPSMKALDPRRPRYDGEPMAGIDLIDYVMDSIPGHVYHQRVADIMDEMLEDGELKTTLPNDEWSLA